MKRFLNVGISICDRCTALIHIKSTQSFVSTTDIITFLPETFFFCFFAINARRVRPSDYADRADNKREYSRGDISFFFFARKHCKINVGRACVFFLEKERDLQWLRANRGRIHVFKDLIITSRGGFFFNTQHSFSELISSEINKVPSGVGTL